MNMSLHQPPTPSYECSIELDSLMDPSDELEEFERDHHPSTPDLPEYLDVEHQAHGSKPTLAIEEDQRASGSLKPKRKHGTEWWVEWRLEVLSGMLSILSLVGTVVTLKSNQGKPLPQWPFDISINALISIYSVVLKICITFVIQSCISQQQWVWFASERQLYDAALFESARQGPYGSAVWIWVHRLRQPLTTLGAFVLILSVAVDPFYQQVLHYADCETPLQEIATTARSNYFTVRRLFQDNGPMRHMSFDAESALTSSVYSRPHAIQPQCSSGNCTFAAYSTVGYCNECQDISEDLKFTAIEQQNKHSCGAPDGSQNYVITSYLPSNFSTTWNDSDYLLTQVLSSWIPPDGPVLFEIIVGKTVFSDLKLDPATGENLTRCDGLLDSDSDWRCRGYGAARCSLFPCVRTYDTNVSVGIVTEILTEHTTLEILRNRRYWNGKSHMGASWGPTDGSLVLVNTSCISPEDKHQLSKQGHQTDSKWLLYDMSNDLSLELMYPSNAVFPASMVACGCTYAFDDIWVDDALREFIDMSGFLSGNVTGSISVSINIDPHRNGSSTCDLALMSTFSGPSELQVLYNSSNTSFQGIQEIFDNMATSLTNYMRTNGHENYSAPAQGIVWHYATRLEVRWA